MPVTWCYEVADEYRKYCSTGFPIGSHVTADRTGYLMVGNAIH